MGKLSSIDSSCASRTGENSLKEPQLESSSSRCALPGLLLVSWAEEAAKEGAR